MAIVSPASDLAASPAAEAAPSGALSVFRRKLSPYWRGGIYYAVHFAIVSIYFSYVNVAFIQRGVTGVQLGTLSAVGSVLALLSSPLLTALADRKGWHLMMIGMGNILFGLSVIGVNFAGSFGALLLLTGVGAFFKAPANPIGDALVVRMANKHQIDFGQMRVWGSISFTVFCLLAGWLWDLIGLEWLFWIGGSIFVLRAMMSLLLDPPEKSAAVTQSRNGRSWLQPLRDQYFLIFLLGMFLWGCSMNGYFGYISIYINQLSQSTTLVGIAVALPAITEMPSIFAADRLMRRFGMLPVLALGIALLVGVSFAAAFTANATWLIVLNSIRGLGFGFWIVVGVRYVDSRAPADQVGIYQSLSSLAVYSLPALLFMPLLGYVYDTLGVTRTFLISGAMGILTLVVLLRLHFLSTPDAKAGRS